jgi:hypothetical protein
MAGRAFTAPTAAAAVPQARNKACHPEVPVAKAGTRPTADAAAAELWDRLQVTVVQPQAERLARQPPWSDSGSGIDDEMVIT